KDKPRPILRPLPYIANGFEEVPHAIEIDPVALLEVGLSLAGNNGGKVEDEIGAAPQQLPGNLGPGHVDAKAPDRNIGLRHRCRHDIGEDDLGNIAMPERARSYERLGQLASNHAGGANDEYLQ